MWKCYINSIRWDSAREERMNSFEVPSFPNRSWLCGHNNIHLFGRLKPSSANQGRQSPFSPSKQVAKPCLPLTGRAGVWIDVGKVGINLVQFSEEVPGKPFAFKEDNIWSSMEHKDLDQLGG
ncbi:hypothetical protein GJ744_001347 [Endocarpon pusillum]|uniref:Uncharacterized protein n=1 Tax=Endocarpon pusillum TaxID=364733 RepID=A0A8H7E7S4_9EURO|nr:hypothetical protein GJ744_001347 [Endocarpon pusillum]